MDQTYEDVCKSLYEIVIQLQVQWRQICAKDIMKVPQRPQAPMTEGQMWQLIAHDNLKGGAAIATFWLFISPSRMKTVEGEILLDRRHDKTQRFVSSTVLASLSRSHPFSKRTTILSCYAWFCIRSLTLTKNEISYRTIVGGKEYCRHDALPGGQYDPVNINKVLMNQDQRQKRVEGRYVSRICVLSPVHACSESVDHKYHF